jgi:tRNA dimethylallyltransferase
MIKENQVPAIVGPTGIGKTEIAIAVAEQLDLDIVSADSRQIYKYMDIGTAKPEKTAFPRVHMTNLITPDQIYSAGDYARDARALIAELAKNNKRCLVVGGSGLYIRALFKPFADMPADPQLREKLKNESQLTLYKKLSTIDPEAAACIHPHDHQRTARALEVYELTGIPFSVQLKSQPKPAFTPVYIGLDMPRKDLYAKIENRFDSMLKAGFIEEVKNLKALGYTRDLYAFNALGYQELFDFVEERLSLAEAVQQAKQKTKEYAKRQLTWFRHTEGVSWIKLQDIEGTVREVIEIINNAKIKMQNEK